MKLFRYLKVYSYGDCADEFLVYAKTKLEAIEKLEKYKVKLGYVNTIINSECVNEVKFNEDGICELS